MNAQMFSFATLELFCHPPKIWSSVTWFFLPWISTRRQKRNSFSGSLGEGFIGDFEDSDVAWRGGCRLEEEEDEATSWGASAAASREEPGERTDITRGPAKPTTAHMHCNGQGQFLCCCCGSSGVTPGITTVQPHFLYPRWWSCRGHTKEFPQKRGSHTPTPHPTHKANKIISIPCNRFQCPVDHKIQSHSSGTKLHAKKSKKIFDHKKLWLKMRTFII